MSDVAIVFHGAFGFLSTECNIEVYVPKISAHVNLFGTWAGLRELEEGRDYMLDGVIGSTDDKVRLDPRSNVVFEHLGTPRPDGYFCRITIPRPKSITSLRKEPIDANRLLAGVTSKVGRHLPHPRSLSHVQVYRYTEDGAARLTSGEAVYEVPSAADGYRVLHFFSEPATLYMRSGDGMHHERAHAATAHAMAMGNGGFPPVGDRAPFQRHEHVALEDVLRMFPATSGIKVNVPDRYM